MLFYVVCFQSPEGAHLSWEPPQNTAGRIIEYSVYLAVRNAAAQQDPVSETKNPSTFMQLYMLVLMCVFFSFRSTVALHSWRSFACTAVRVRRASWRRPVCHLRMSTTRPNQPSSSALPPETRRDMDQPLKCGGCKVRVATPFLFPPTIQRSALSLVFHMYSHLSRPSAKPLRGKDDGCEARNANRRRVSF